VPFVQGPGVRAKKAIAVGERFLFVGGMGQGAYYTTWVIVLFYLYFSIYVWTGGQKRIEKDRRAKKTTGYKKSFVSTTHKNVVDVPGRPGQTKP
jgi:hypothetical protein